MIHTVGIKNSFHIPDQDSVLRLDEEGTQVSFPLYIGQDFVAADTVHFRSGWHPQMVRIMSFGSLRSGTMARVRRAHSAE